MLSTGLMAMLSGPAMFIGMGVVRATGWAIFMGPEGMLTEAMLTGPVMVTGCCRLTGDVMLTVLVLMFICAAMVTGWLLTPRFIVVVMGADMLTGVAAAELHTPLPSEGGERNAGQVANDKTRAWNYCNYWQGENTQYHVFRSQQNISQYCALW